MSTRGSRLENAIARACVWYERNGRAVVKKQHVLRVASGIYATKAPVDFLGVAREVGAVALECKECDASSFPFNADHITERQCEALDAQLLQGAAAFLVVEMTAYRETFRVPWSAVQKFMRAPWRNSLSLAWLRAFGDVCKELGTDSKRTVFFLDVAPHPLRETSYLAVVEDKSKAGSKAVELYPAEHKPSQKRAQRFAERPAPGTPEHREYLIKLAEEGARKAAGAVKRKPRRKGYGR